MSPIIEISGLGKRYFLNHQPGGYQTLRDVIASTARRPWKFVKSLLGRADGAGGKDTFWALRGIDLKVNRGDIVGVIGSNGAGKSTLLKIVTGITPPTEGQAVLRGRVASLLEVGTGFHPELTGRDNIFLNGAILGMSRAEISQKFDAIVEFAGVERFLDTPVKFYSSGMYVRLAFSVAAHLEPDILLVDEVLAVGDAAFQRKCLGKMKDVTRQGERTILFVSHNMGAVAQLCNRCVMLDGGRVIKEGEPNEVIDFYLRGLKRGAREIELEEEKSLPVQIMKMRLEDENQTLISEAEMGSDLNLSVEYVVRKEVYGLSIGVAISKDMIPIFYSLNSDLDDAVLGDVVTPGRYKATVKLPTSLLKEGEYSVDMNYGDAAGSLPDARQSNASLALLVVNTKEDLTHKSYRQDRKGLLYQKLVWKRERL